MGDDKQKLIQLYPELKKYEIDNVESIRIFGDSDMFTMIFYPIYKTPTSISGGFRFQTSGGVESPSEAPMFSFAERVHLKDDIVYKNKY